MSRIWPSFITSSNSNNDEPLLKVQIWITGTRGLPTPQGETYYLVKAEGISNKTKSLSNTSMKEAVNLEVLNRQGFISIECWFADEGFYKDKLIGIAMIPIGPLSNVVQKAWFPLGCPKNEPRTPNNQHYGEVFVEVIADQDNNLWQSLTYNLRHVTRSSCLTIKKNQVEYVVPGNAEQIEMKFDMVTLETSGQLVPRQFYLTNYRLIFIDSEIKPRVSFDAETSFSRLSRRLDQSSYVSLTKMDSVSRLIIRGCQSLVIRCRDFKILRIVFPKETLEDTISSLENRLSYHILNSVFNPPAFVLYDQILSSSDQSQFHRSSSEPSVSAYYNKNKRTSFRNTSSSIHSKNLGISLPSSPSPHSEMLILSPPPLSDPFASLRSPRDRHSMDLSEPILFRENRSRSRRSKVNSQPPKIEDDENNSEDSKKQQKTNDIFSSYSTIFGHLDDFEIEDSKKKEIKRKLLKCEMSSQPSELKDSETERGTIVEAEAKGEEELKKEYENIKKESELTKPKAVSFSIGDDEMDSINPQQSIQDIQDGATELTNEEYKETNQEQVIGNPLENEDSNKDKVEKPDEVKGKESLLILRILSKNESKQMKILLKILFLIIFYRYFFKKNPKKTKIIKNVKNRFSFSYRFEMIEEMTRQGVNLKHWRYTTINRDYQFSETYPSVFYIPAKITDEELSEAKKFRSKGRIAVLTWYNRKLGNCMIRSSQPNVGFSGVASAADINLLEQTRLSSYNTSALVIFDARSRLAAEGNKIKGHGTESPAIGYEKCQIYFLEIANIHSVRLSIERLRNLIESGSSLDESNWLEMVQQTQWLHHISRLISSALKIAYHVEELGVSVLVHCSDGWDRTAQLCSLSQILLDPFFRTIHGFKVLVEKEWISFGHKFRDRLGDPSSTQIKMEQSPVFLQFLDCVWQILEQFPSAFEFNSNYLITLADCHNIGWFGNFLFNCEKERNESNCIDNTLSIWDYFDTNKDEFTNPNYIACNQVLIPVGSIKSLKLWNSYFLRFDKIYHAKFSLKQADDDSEFISHEHNNVVLWLPDDAAHRCHNCHSPFNFFIRRKHHCRNCGFIFCSSCVDKRIKLPLLGYETEQKVCGHCYTSLIVSQTTEASESELETFQEFSSNSISNIKGITRRFSIFGNQL